MTCPDCNRPLTVERFRNEPDPADNGNAVSCACGHEAWVTMAELEDERAQARDAREDARREDKAMGVLT